MRGEKRGKNERSDQRNKGRREKREGAEILKKRRKRGSTRTRTRGSEREKYRTNVNKGKQQG